MWLLGLGWGPHEPLEQLQLQSPRSLQRSWNYPNLMSPTPGAKSTPCLPGIRVHFAEASVRRLLGGACDLKEWNPGLLETLCQLCPRELCCWAYSPSLGQAASLPPVPFSAVFRL